jgi:hypothetical protein
VRAIPCDGEPGTPLWTHRVRQQPSGNLIGRVRSLHPVSGRPLIPPLTEVALHRNGRLVTTGRTDEQGVFATGRVQPGLYTLIARTVFEPDDPHLDQQRVDAEVKQDLPVGLLEGRHHRAGFAAFAIEVAPAVALVSADTTGEDESLPALNEPLELDFALIDPLDLLSLTRTRSSGRERTLTGNSSTSTGSRTAPIAAAAALTPLLTSPGSGGGGGGPISFPIIPGGGGGGGGGSIMSPATL